MAQGSAVPNRIRVIATHKAALDNRLSFRARGVLAFLVESGMETTSADELSKLGIEGRDAIRSALKALEATGYLERSRRQNGSGHWITESVVRAIPTGNGFPGAGSAPTGNGFPGANNGLKADSSQQQLEPLAPTEPAARDNHQPPTNRATAKSKSTPRAPAGAELPDAPPDVIKSTTKRIVDRVYATKDPKPTENYMGVRGVVRRLLEAGWSATEVERACMDTAPMTNNALLVALNRGRRGQRGKVDPNRGVTRQRSATTSMEVLKP